MGGLAGCLNGTYLENCYTRVAVIGVEDASGGGCEALSGLIGWARDISLPNTYVNACYAAGPITPAAGMPNVGGLVGYYEGGVFENCFWDKQVSGQFAGPVGVGETTASMKGRGIFTTAGWDFDDIWAGGEGLQLIRL